ncbi:MAG: sodium ion-translocating decarboxylase subunit beta [Bacteroidales bacterium]|nr:sodium ion-translocating decarboxylase subunit beta [Bacteroidales bacterium]
MLGKKSIYRKPAVILGSLVLLMLLNMVVVNNPMFATKVADLGKTEQVSDMTAEQSNAQLAEIAAAIVAQQGTELQNQIESLDSRVSALEGKKAQAKVQTAQTMDEEPTMKAQFREGIHNFWLLTGFRNCKIGNLIMILVGILFIFLAVRFEFEPMLLIPIGTGIICGNIPFFQGTGITLTDALGFAQNAIASGAYSFDLETAKALLLTIFDSDNEKHMVLSEAIKQVDHLKLTEFGLAANEIESVKAFMNEVFQSGELNLQTGLYQKGSVLNYLYFGVTSGVYPPLIFLGIGAMTDFSSLIANPKLMILGAAAQLGVFLTFIGALYLGFNLREAGAIGIIGGADGPTAIFLSSRLANGTNGTRNLIGPIAIAAYSYMALVPVIQPPIIRLLTTKEERLIKMRAPRMVNKTEKIMFPVVGLILTTFISPTALPLLGMLFFGNIIKESGVVKRLQNTASNPLIDIVTMILGLTVGASTQASVFLTSSSIKIFVLGACSFAVATAGGLLGAKLMNLFLKEKINPMIGAAGVSAVPDSARVVEVEGQKYDPSNHLLMHAMAPNVSGVIGSAVAAGVMMSFLMM